MENKLIRPPKWVFIIIAIILFLSGAVINRANAQEGLPSDSPITALQKFDLVSADDGWLLLDQRLYWTHDGGQNWLDMTPPDLGQSTIRAVTFLDAQHGWLILTDINSSGAVHTLARTGDGGQTWERLPLSLFNSGDANPIAAAFYPFFLDPQTGWLVVKHATSSNFSTGSLFKTTDGGATWTRLTIPIGEPVYFVTDRIGWTAGGTGGNELYRTQDGGQTWTAQTIELPAALENRQPFYQRPTFVNPKEGVLPVFVTGQDKGQVIFYRTGDAGQSWQQSTSVSLKGEFIPDASLPLSVIDLERSVLVMPDSNQLLKISDKDEFVTMTGQDDLVSGITQLDMVTPEAGWARYVAADCTVTSVLDNIPSSSSETTDCRSETRLLRTEDGGQSWSTLELPGLDTPGIIRTFTNVTSSENSADEAGTGELSIQALGDQTRTFTGQGFDKCEIATLSQLQNWVSNSPYRAVNLYIGGSSRACSNSALSSSFLTQASQQGWKFIPTWVGPQAACTGFSTRMSYDPTTAYNQGVAEANAALTVAANLGLALPDKSGTVIYYDLEGYDTGNSACRTAANAFISGWTAQLQSKGNEAGVYGSACASAISDFAGISHVPDAVWPAHWLVPYQYRSDASVWDIACVSNSLWANHQRIRQYAGGHNETWGGVTLNIDSNVIDGLVADISDGIPPVTSVTLSGTLGESNWYRSNVQVTLTAQDNSGGSGVKLIQYKLDDGSWQTYSGPFTVSTEGSHTVYFKAHDNAGNWESENRISFGIDKNAPTGSLVINKDASVTHATLVYLHPTAADATSAVSRMRFRDAGGAWTGWLSYNSKHLWQLPGPTGQTFTVEAQFKDRAGNESGVYTDAIPLDIYPDWPASTTYRLAKTTLGVSGGPSSSAGYHLRGTLGQPSAVSIMADAAHTSSWGYWAILSVPPEEKVYLPVIVK